jgi:hypothetical protein
VLPGMLRLLTIGWKSLCKDCCSLLKPGVIRATCIAYKTVRRWWTQNTFIVPDPDFRVPVGIGKPAATAMACAGNILPPFRFAWIADKKGIVDRVLVFVD